MALRDHLGIVSATLGTAAALTGLAYVLTRRESPLMRPSTGALSESSGRFAPYIDKARTELEAKGLKQIQVETALTWTGRACAAAARGRHEDAHEYAHEGIEHAALSGQDELLDQVRAVLMAYGVEV
jgi:hypothetical protein